MIVWQPLPEPLLRAVAESGFAINSATGSDVPFILIYDPHRGWQGAFAHDDQRILGQQLGSSAIGKVGTSHVLVVPPNEWMPDRLHQVQRG